jgi:hypothetical protein
MFWYGTKVSERKPFYSQVGRKGGRNFPQNSVRRCGKPVNWHLSRILLTSLHVLKTHVKHTITKAALKVSCMHSRYTAKASVADELATRIKIF